MLGLLPGHATLSNQLAALGMQSIVGAQGEMRGHTFHYSHVRTPLAPALTARYAQSEATGERMYRSGAIVASYLHGYWPTNPAFLAALFHGDAI
jgi:cobyrinic acid a,c-diamide synthase